MLNIFKQNPFLALILIVGIVFIILCSREGFLNMNKYTKVRQARIDLIHDSQDMTTNKTPSSMYQQGLAFEKRRAYLDGMMEDMYEQSQA